MSRRELVVTGLLGFLLVAPLATPAGESASGLTGCPGYTDHLRNARAYLVRSDRANAIAELKRARESLRGCEAAQASETALACAVASRGS